MAKKAIDNGFKVIGIQRPVPSYRSRQIVYRLKELNIFDEIQFEVIDLTNKKKLNDLIDRYKPVYFAHLGSQSSVKKSTKFKKLTEESNYLISKNIIESLEQFSKDTILFFPSSANIYEGYQNRLVNEATTARPMTNYAISKYKTQKFISSKSNLQLNTGILFSHESEFRRPNFFSKRVTEFLSEYYFTKNGCLEIGDISIERDIGYAKEYVDAIYEILVKNNSKEYIVSSNRLYKLKEIIDISLDLLGIKYHTLYDEGMLSYVDTQTNKKFIISDKREYRKYDLRGIKGDNTIIKKEIGWEPKIGLDEICSRMINYEINRYR